MMFVATLVLLFLIKLRFPRGKSIVDIIISRYGRPTLQLFRRTQKLEFTVKKLDLDIRFLTTCKNYEVIPNFIRFKVYSPGFRFTRTYQAWLKKLLEFEINNQNKKLAKSRVMLRNLHTDLKNSVSFIDYRCLSSLLTSNSDRKLSQVRNTHSRKLRNLGIDLSRKVDKNRVIFNLSDKILTEDEKDVLTLGLDFGLPPKRTSYIKYFLGFERLCYTLKNCCIYGEDSWTALYNNLSVVANSSYRKHCKIFSSDYECDKVSTLNRLRNDDSLIISKPDKGRDVVIQNRTDYDQKNVRNNI